MKIKDLQGKYILKGDIQRGIIYEWNIGYWRSQDIERFQNDYAKNIVPLFKGKPWAKCCDLRDYKTSMITEEIKEHVKWCIQNGNTVAVIIVNGLDIYKSVIELQMKIAAKHSGHLVWYCTDREEAEQWLRERGF